MTHYSIELGDGFLSFARNLPNKCVKKLLDSATKAGLDALKTVFKKLINETAEARGEFIGKKVADKIAKPKSVPDEISINVAKKVIPP